jgi:S-formylglutathione hydrolase FrmB
VALLECKFFSEALGLSSSMTVILPQNTLGQIGLKNEAYKGSCKTLYLLHGLSDDHSIWLRRTSIERYVASLGIAVIMPAVNRSFYTDMAYGEAYETFIAQELPQIARSFFHLSARREDNYIAGLSMGGYGAFRMALKYPGQYCAAASLSGVLDLAAWVDSDRKLELASLMRNAFGENPIKGSQHDLMHLMKKLKSSDKRRPRLYACCGDNDHLYQENLDFLAHAKKLKFPLAWQGDAGYAHTWDYRDLRIQDVLKWMLK